MKAIKKIYLIGSFLLFYFFKMIQANLSIAYDILSIRMETQPGFVTVPLRVRSNIGILLFTNLLSMTPGTLSVDIDEDKESLLVHCLYKTEDNVVLAEIEEMQNKIIYLTT